MNFEANPTPSPLKKPIQTLTPNKVMKRQTLKLYSHVYIIFFTCLFLMPACVGPDIVSGTHMQVICHFTASKEAEMIFVC